MSPPDLRRAPTEKLRFLAQTVRAEADLLTLTDGRLFALPMDAHRAGTLREDIDLGERVDAFVARFGRLQDTLADKLLPEILNWLGEAVGPAIDNVARAERLGWISDGQDAITNHRRRAARARTVCVTPSSTCASVLARSPGLASNPNKASAPLARTRTRSVPSASRSNDKRAPGTMSSRSRSALGSVTWPFSLTTAVTDMARTEADSFGAR